MFPGCMAARMDRVRDRHRARPEPGTVGTRHDGYGMFCVVSPGHPTPYFNCIGSCARVPVARQAPLFRRRRGRHHRGDIRDTNHVRDRPFASVLGGPGTAPISPPATAPERRRRAGSAARAQDPRLRERGQCGYVRRGPMHGARSQVTRWRPKTALDSMTADESGAKCAAGGETRGSRLLRRRGAVRARQYSGSVPIEMPSTLIRSNAGPFALWPVGVRGDRPQLLPTRLSPMGRHPRVQPNNSCGDYHGSACRGALIEQPDGGTCPWLAFGLRSHTLNPSRY